MFASLKSQGCNLVADPSKDLALERQSSVQLIAAAVPATIRRRCAAIRRTVLRPKQASVLVGVPHERPSFY